MGLGGGRRLRDLVRRQRADVGARAVGARHGRDRRARDDELLRHQPHARGGVIGVIGGLAAQLARRIEAFVRRDLLGMKPYEAARIDRGLVECPAIERRTDQPIRRHRMCLPPLDRFTDARALGILVGPAGAADGVLRGPRSIRRNAGLRANVGIVRARRRGAEHAKQSRVAAAQLGSSGT